MWGWFLNLVVYWFIVYYIQVVCCGQRKVSLCHVIIDYGNTKVRRYVDESDKTSQQFFQKTMETQICKKLVETVFHKAFLRERERERKRVWERDV